MAKSAWQSFLDALDFLGDPLGSRYTRRSIRWLLSESNSRKSNQSIGSGRLNSEKERMRTLRVSRESHVHQLLKRKRRSEAERVLREWTVVEEIDARRAGHQIAIFPYAKLAELLKEDGRHTEEKEVLTRYMRQPHGDSRPSSELARRLLAIDSDTTKDNS